MGPGKTLGVDGRLLNLRLRLDPRGACRAVDAWNVVYKLLSERGLLGDGLDVEEYTRIHS